MCIIHSIAATSIKNAEYNLMSRKYMRATSAKLINSCPFKQNDHLYQAALRRSAKFICAVSQHVRFYIDVVVEMCAFRQHQQPTQPSNNKKNCIVTRMHYEISLWTDLFDSDDIKFKRNQHTCNDIVVVCTCEFACLQMHVWDCDVVMCEKCKCNQYNSEGHCQQMIKRLERRLAICECKSLISHFWRWQIILVAFTWFYKTQTQQSHHIHHIHNYAQYLHGSYWCGASAYLIA